MPVNPYKKYKEQSVMTLTQGEMLIRLYDETVKQMQYATVYIEQRNVEKTNTALKKAQKILYHLQSTLNFKYEISNNLWSLYDYFIHKLVEANVQKSAAPIEEIIPMVVDLKDAYAQAERHGRA